MNSEDCSYDSILNQCFNVAYGTTFQCNQFDYKKNLYGSESPNYQTYGNQFYGAKLYGTQSYGTQSYGTTSYSGKFTGGNYTNTTSSYSSMP